MDKGPVRANGVVIILYLSFVVFYQTLQLGFFRRDILAKLLRVSLKFLFNLRAILLWGVFIYQQVSDRAADNAYAQRRRADGDLLLVA
ncbi:MAG: hypothetical protein FWC61_00595, partial [Proteobacteria bacterium]|nr:hypothetical protein [Pseudomonadota bacterium]